MGMIGLLAIRIKPRIPINGHSFDANRGSDPAFLCPSIHVRAVRSRVQLRRCDTEVRVPHDSCSPVRDAL